MTNIFDDLPQHLPKEVVQTLIQAADVRIERIISHGHASAADFWYDQPQHEWVIVLKGAARFAVRGWHGGDDARRLHQHSGVQEAPGRLDDAR